MKLPLRILALLAVLLCTALPALAGDRAIFDPIGYSNDARYFAFEEFGLAGRAKLPFASISVVDLNTGGLVKGAPFAARAGVDLPGLALAHVRGQAANAAATTLKRLGIVRPAEYRVLLADGVKADGRSLSWSAPDCCGPGSSDDPVSTLTLTTFPLPAGAACRTTTGQPPLGFALSLGGTEIFRDKALPEARGCTLDYRLYAVLAPFDGESDLVAIVGYNRFGLNGADRRFLAVPLGR